MEFEEISKLFHNTITDVEKIKEEELESILNEVYAKLDQLNSEIADCVMLKTMLQLRIERDKLKKQNKT